MLVSLLTLFSQRLQKFVLNRHSRNGCMRNNVSATSSAFIWGLWRRCLFFYAFINVISSQAQIHTKSLHKWSLLFAYIRMMMKDAMSLEIQPIINNNLAYCFPISLMKASGVTLHVTVLCVIRFNSRCMFNVKWMEEDKAEFDLAIYISHKTHLTWTIKTNPNKNNEKENRKEKWIYLSFREWNDNTFPFLCKSRSSDLPVVNTTKQQ